MELEGRVPEVLSPLEENQGAWDAVTRVLMAVTCQPPPAKEGFVVQTFLPGQGQLTQPGKRPTTWTMVGVGGTLLWPGTQEKSPQCPSLADETFKYPVTLKGPPPDPGAASSRMVVQGLRAAPGSCLGISLTPGKQQQQDYHDLSP